MWCYAIKKKHIKGVAQLHLKLDPGYFQNKTKQSTKRTLKNLSERWAGCLLSVCEYAAKILLHFLARGVYYNSFKS